MFKVKSLIYLSFKKRYHLLTFAFLLTCFSSVFSQTSTRIVGTVVDKVDGDLLPGANVYLEGTSIGASTNEDGEYVILNVPAGSYTLMVKYIGYKDLSMDVTVNEGETLNQTLEIEYIAIEGETITVTAQAEGQIAAINQQLASATITNVVSADRIQDVPDANAAESVSRLPGISLIRSGGEGQKVAIRGLSPKYNVIKVNGVRMQSTTRDDRAVDLNMIAPNTLSGIEVTKALTADMDADAVGGTVNLKIGTAPKGFKSSSSLQGGHGSLADTYGNFRANALLSNRFLDNKLGIRVSGFFDKFDRSSDVLSASWGIRNLEDGSRLPLLGGTTITDRKTDRERFGGGVILDYQFSNGSLVLNNFVSRLHQEQEIVTNNLTTTSGFSASANLNELNNTVFNNALQGEFEFFNIGMDFSLSNSVSKQDHPGNLSMSIYTGNAGNAIDIPQELFDGRDEYNNPLVQRLEPHEFLDAVSRSENDIFTNRFSTAKRDITESAQEAALNFNLPYNFTNWLSGNLKFGGKFVHNIRENDEDVWYTAQRTEINISFMDSLIAGWWDDAGFIQDDGNIGIRAHLFEDENYDIGNFLSGEEGVDKFYFMPDFDKMRKLIRIADNNKVTTTRYGYGPAHPVDEQPSAQYDYDYSRDLSAFYVQTDLNIGEYVTLYPGLRYESFDVDYEARYTLRYGVQPNDYRSTKINVDTISVGGDKLHGITGDNWFPQIQLQVKPLDWLDVRLASTKSIIYPDYRAVSPYRFFNQVSSPNQLTIGNPYLKPAIAQNYDIYTSVYDNYIGLFTVGFFYKEMKNLTVATSYLTRDSEDINNLYPLSPTQNSSINTWENIDAKSFVRGIELDWQTHFWYLPSYFKGLVLNINFTHINSKTRYPYQTSIRETRPPFRVTFVDSSRAGRMPNQPNDVLNVTLGYDIGDFSARLSLVYQDDVIAGIDRNYKERDVHTDTFTRWDFTARQKLPWYKGLEAYLNMNNISNEPDRRFFSTGKKLNSVEYYGFTTDFGLRYTF